MPSALSPVTDNTDPCHCGRASPLCSQQTSRLCTPRVCCRRSPLRTLASTSRPSSWRARAAPCSCFVLMPGEVCHSPSLLPLLWPLLSRSVCCYCLLVRTCQQLASYRQSLCHCSLTAPCLFLLSSRRCQSSSSLESSLHLLHLSCPPSLPSCSSSAWVCLRPRCPPPHRPPRHPMPSPVSAPRVCRSPPRCYPRHHSALCHRWACLLRLRTSAYRPPLTVTNTPQQRECEDATSELWCGSSEFCMLC